MKQNMKKAFALIASIMMATIMMFSNMSMNTSAATNLTNSQITAKLTSLQSKYKNGSYWISPSTQKYGGYQCYAFARQLAVDVFGSYPAKNVVNAVDGEKSNGWTAYRTASKVTLEPGDIIRSDYNSHTAMIWKIEENYVYVGQCFGSQNDKINWGAFWGNHKRATVSELLGAGFNGVWKHPGYTEKVPNPPSLQTGAIYTIHPKGVNLYIASSGTKNLANVCLSNKVNNYSKWKLQYDNSKQAFYFVNIASNRVLDINGSSVKNGGGQNCQIYDKNSCETEYFDLVKNSDGTYIIRNHRNTNVCIDCYGSIKTLKNSSNVWTYSINYDNTQKFVFTKVG